jgi:hypothetical protein
MSPRRNWDSPNPSLASECAPPPRTGGGGHTRLRVRGWGSPNSDEWRKSLPLCAYFVHFPVRLLPSLSNLEPVCLSACLVFTFSSACLHSYSFANSTLHSQLVFLAVSILGGIFKLLWSQGIDSASLCSLAGRCNNLNPTWFLAPKDFSKIPTQLNCRQACLFILFKCHLPVCMSAYVQLLALQNSLCSRI